MRIACALFAFGFSNLAMLGWLAAAAAPLLIHLWSRHRFRESPWAAMQFLLAAMQKNARRLQLQQWLLLAVRTLIIVLVVLAVAEPYGEQLLAGGSATPTHKVIVIDGSYSMAYRGNGNTNFAHAKQLAAELVEKSRLGDVFTVILMTRAPKSIVGPEVLDHAAVANQIESLTQSQAGADLPGTLRLVRDALTRKDGRNSPRRKEVYFFTDLQRRTWAALENNNRAATGKNQSEITAAIQSLARDASVVMIDIGQPKANNLAVTHLEVSDSMITRGRDASFAATLHVFGQEPRTKWPVEFLVDDVPVGEQRIDVAAGSDVAVHFVHRFQSPGDHTVTCCASGDRLELDNLRSLTVPVREEIRVLCVAGSEGAAKYLVGALNPNPGGDSPIRPVIVSEGDLAEAALPDFDCVFICNVAQLTASEADRLAGYAEKGGGVVFFLGDRVVPGSYNTFAVRQSRNTSEPAQTVTAGQAEAPLIPARIGEPIAQPQFGLDPLEYRHPIVAPFRGRERAGLLTTPVARYYRLDVSKSAPGVEVAVAMPGGDPFIVTSPLGRGRTVLVATDGSLSSVDPTSGEPWTTWPIWPSFLPIVRELLAYASGGQHDRWQQLVGTPLTGSIAQATSAGLNGGELQMVRPDGRAAPVTVQTSTAGWDWSYSDTDVSGVYEMRGLPQGRIQKFAVNVDAAEGDLARVDPEQLPRQLKVHSTWRNGEDARTEASVESQSAWNQSLLWTVLALLFAESFMAWQFGRGAL